MPPYGGLPCSFFLKCSDGYELHFCTIERNQDTSVHTWYRWHLGKDFSNSLVKYGRLPLGMRFEDLMETMKERDDLKQLSNEQRDELKELKNEMLQSKSSLANQREIVQHVSLESETTI